MREDFILIALFLLTLFYLSKSVESFVMMDNSHNVKKDHIEDMLVFFNSQKHLGDVDTNFADITTHMSVYEGETSCSFLYMNNQYRCFVSGKNENQRLAMLELLAGVIESDFEIDKMIWIKPFTGVKNFNGVDYFEA